MDRSVVTSRSNEDSHLLSLLSSLDVAIVLVGVSYLAPTSKFIIHVSGSGEYAQRAQDLYWLG